MISPYSGSAHLSSHLSVISSEGLGCPRNHFRIWAKRTSSGSPCYRRPWPENPAEALGLHPQISPLDSDLSYQPKAEIRAFSHLPDGARRLPGGLALC